MTEEEVLKKIIRHEEQGEPLPAIFVRNWGCREILMARGWSSDWNTQLWNPPPYDAVLPD